MPLTGSTDRGEVSSNHSPSLWFGRRGLPPALLQILCLNLGMAARSRCTKGLGSSLIWGSLAANKAIEKAPGFGKCNSVWISSLCFSYKGWLPHKKQRKPNTKEFMLCLGPVLQCLATGEFLLHFFLCDTMKAPTSLGVKWYPNKWLRGTLPYYWSQIIRKITFSNPQKSCVASKGLQLEKK